MSLRKPDRRLWQSAILGAIAGRFAADKAASPDSSSHGSSGSKKAGCWGCAGIVLVLAMLGLALERFGCVATERSLRENVRVSLVASDIQPEKNVVWARFELRNGSKWPVSAAVVAEAFQTTRQYAVSVNSIELLNVPAGSTSEGRIGLDLGQLHQAGIDDPHDRDLCDIRVRLKWVCEAGKEQWQKGR